ncbi:hypothetical protein K0M31_010032 [Melipona bicolor]|uniref:Uncharacterized protein n=1 Tax=Melipona bicolor TaxID=60889 RepID=A0AA40KIR1_9HYME|nr:hypothetical protein K0M31_010032 [Melipona bicolor]
MFCIEEWESRKVRLAGGAQRAVTMTARFRRWRQPTVKKVGGPEDPEGPKTKISPSVRDVSKVKDYYPESLVTRGRAGDEDYGSIRAIKWRNLSARLASRVAASSLARQQPAEGSPWVQGSKEAKRGRDKNERGGADSPG